MNKNESVIVMVNLGSALNILDKKQSKHLGL